MHLLEPFGQEYIYWERSLLKTHVLQLHFESNFRNSNAGEREHIVSLFSYILSYSYKWPQSGMVCETHPTSVVSAQEVMYESDGGVQYQSKGLWDRGAADWTPNPGNGTWTLTHTHTHTHWENSIPLHICRQFKLADWHHLTAASWKTSVKSIILNEIYVSHVHLIAYWRL